MLKKRRVFFLVLALLAACSPRSASPQTDLRVTCAGMQKTYTLEDLQALGAARVDFLGVTYLGVPLVDLLESAGLDPASLTRVRAVGSDGYSISYDASVFSLPEATVAYARLDGPLAADELPFRMVLPGQESKLSVRMLVEIDACP